MQVEREPRLRLWGQPRKVDGPSGINPGFPGLFRCRGWITHALLTRSPLSPKPKPWFSLDLHVLSAPPAFVLSQDQTLREVGLARRTNRSLRACAQSCLPDRAGVTGFF